MAVPFVIPKFREKIIYWQTTGGTGVSYPVSASFKGILRLSPNDDLTLQEKEPIKLYDEDIENYYRDCIDPAITQQFIRVSTSDGYFVGLRLNQYDIEADNLYVIGPSEFSLVRIYATSDDAFKIKNNTSLPARANNNIMALIDSTELINKDFTEIDPKSAVDQAYTLISRQLEKRNFTYEQTVQLIRKLVIEAMLDLKTIPTGSIHYVPMSIAQYLELIKKGKPNSYFKNDSETDVNDPIIRDYLICDGSLYKNEQFPELAKILEGERIDYWRFEASKQRMVQETYINDYTENKQFRVPDLRARFIKSIILDRNMASDPNNQTGMYSCDARPVNASATVDNHVHFITTGFYQYSADGSVAPNMTSYSRVADIEKKDGQRDKWKLNVSNTPGVVYPENKMQDLGDIPYGWDYPYYRYGGGCTGQATGPNQTGYFLSTPENFNSKDPNCTPNVGLSSDDMYSCKETIDNDSEVSYNDRTDFNNYSGQVEAGSYGMENTPEFCCMIPLIRI